MEFIVDTDFIPDVEAVKAAGFPEIVRCKDCKHRFIDGDNVKFNVCELNHNKAQMDNWFCAYAERRQYEKT